MTVITAAELNVTLDNMAFMYAALRGDNNTSEYGIGSNSGVSGTSKGALKGVPTIKEAIVSTFTGNDAIKTVNDTILGLEQSLTLASLAGNPLSPMIAQLTSHVSAAQVVDATVLSGSALSTLDQYLSHLNWGTAGYNNALQAPACRDYIAAAASGTGRTPTFGNYYFEILKDTVYQGTTWANALARFVRAAGVDTPTYASVAIDSAKYAGGFAQLNIVTITGTGTITVTADAYDPHTHNICEDCVFTLAATATGRYDMTPDGADRLIVGTPSLIAAGVGITALNCYVEARRPTSRLAIPS